MPRQAAIVTGAAQGIGHAISKHLADNGWNLIAVDLANDEGVLKEERGDYRGALESYRSALSTYQALGNARQIGSSLLNVGFAYYQVGEFDNAVLAKSQALGEKTDGGYTAFCDTGNL